MHFQLFFPGVTNDSIGALKAAGFVDFVDGHESTLLRSGPGNQGGMLVSWKGNSAFDQAWDWQQFGKFWVGISREKPCTPLELERQQIFDSRSLELDDGQAWSIPVAAKLPSKLRLIDGQWSRVRKPKFEEFWRRSEAWYRRFMLFDLDENSMIVDAGVDRAKFEQEWTEYCVFALRQNYRICSEVASMLGILDENGRLAITVVTVHGMEIKDVIAQMAAARDAESAGLEKKVESGVSDS